MSKLILSFHHGLLFHIETLGLGLQILGGISVHASVTEIDLVQKVQKLLVRMWLARQQAILFVDRSIQCSAKDQCLPSLPRVRVCVTFTEHPDDGFTLLSSHE